jgi:hypothetical protein
MRKRRNAKLALSKETLLKLKGEDLKQVVGAQNATLQGATCDVATCFGDTCVGYTCYNGCTAQSLCYVCYSEGWGC